MRVRIIEPLSVIAGKRKRVCAYARVSSTSDAQGESLENQTTHYRNLIESNPDHEYVGIFADQGITGTKDERPEFQRMLEMARTGKLDLILTKSISRFARNTAIVLEAVAARDEADALRARLGAGIHQREIRLGQHRP